MTVALHVLTAAVQALAPVTGVSLADLAAVQPLNLAVQACRRYAWRARARTVHTHFNTHAYVCA